MIVERIITVPVVSAMRHNGPSVELRRVFLDPDLIKTIVSCAHHEKFLIIQPVFTNKLESLNTLVKNGILSNVEGKWVFNI